ncbi:MAG: S1 RNA-binding domain-containing protein [Chloroflexi bacterium]|nr:S1 RNA-binding domain-containing protein [Chloroflexota bacterium]
MLNEKNLATRFRELLLGGEYDYALPRPNEVIEAVILARNGGDMIVDIGAKRDAVVPARDLQRVSAERVEKLEVGDTIPVMVMRRGVNTSDLIPVSFNQGLQREDWLRAVELHESGEMVACEVTEFNRGGVVVTFGRLRGFVPNSHLGSLASGGRHGQQEESKAALVGRELKLAVIDVDQARRRLVLSRRAVERKLRNELLHELEPGNIRKGVVQNIVDFGAFVDLGGIDGLVHISELAWERVEHPSEVVSLGDEIEVQVLNVDIERQRVGLSRKRLLGNPFEEVTANLNIGDAVSGRVTNVVDFGLFVDIGKGVEGLVHSSKIGDAYGLADPDVEVGSEVLVQVLYVDRDKEQVSLSLVEVLREDEVPPAVADEAIDEGALVSEDEGDEAEETVADGGVLLY